MRINYLDRIRIVLVETTHPGNIGATARAMKTMYLSRLYLVSPKIFPSTEARARAAGADDVLANAVVCNSLQQAVSDCNLVAGTSARKRRISWPIFSPRECAIEFINQAEKNEIAILFGRENSGLANFELEQCNMVIEIPTSSAYSSLNIAAAVQIICYELSIAAKLGKNMDVTPPLHATQAQMKRFYQHLEQCMITIGYFNPGNPRQLRRRLKRLFSRAQLEQEEYHILRGFLAAAEKAAGNNQA